MELTQFRQALDAWLDEHATELTPSGHGLDEAMTHLSKVKRLAYDAGWMRWGWPQRVGGLGGCPYAKGATGNVASEDVVYLLHGLGIQTGVDLDRLALAGDRISAHLGRESGSRVARALAGKRH